MKFLSELKPNEIAPIIVALAAITSSVTAIIAVFVGAIIQTQSSERSVRASVRSTNRQKWINDLREEVAGAMANLIFLQMMAKWEANPEERQKVIQQYIAHTTKVALLINSSKQSHAELLREIHNAVALIQGDEQEKMRLGISVTAIQHKAQGIFKEEWEKVKKLA